MPITYFTICSVATFKSHLKLQINIIATLAYLGTRRVSSTEPPSGAEFKMRGSLATRHIVSAYVRSLDLQHMRFHSSLVLLGVIKCREMRRVGHLLSNGVGRCNVLVWTFQEKVVRGCYGCRWKDDVTNRF